MRPEEFLRAVGLSVRFETHGDFLRARLFHDATGTSVGGMELRRRPEMGGAFQVKQAALSPDLPTGRGIGTNLYQVVRDHIRGKYGVPMASDFVRTSDSERLWRHLKSCCGAKGPRPASPEQAHGGRGENYYTLEATAGSVGLVGPQGPLGGPVRRRSMAKEGAVREGPPRLTDIPGVLRPR